MKKQEKSSSNLQILGDEYAAIMEKALTDRWVDRADNIGKSTGAFCSSPYGVHPYILVTWADDMRSAFTLAHELGHAGHFALAHKHQTYVNLAPPGISSKHRPPCMKDS